MAEKKDGLTKIKDLCLSIETDGNGDTVVSDSYLNLYGVGETTKEAIDEFSSMLIDLYEELEASEGVLSGHLRRQLVILREVLK